MVDDHALDHALGALGVRLTQLLGGARLALVLGPQHRQDVSAQLADRSLLLAIVVLFEGPEELGEEAPVVDVLAWEVDAPRADAADQLAPEALAILRCLPDPLQLVHEMGVGLL